MTEKRINKIESVLRKRQPDLSVITDGVHKTHNVAAIIRTCDAMGVHSIYRVDPAEEFRQAKGTSMGSHRWVQQESSRTCNEPVKTLKKIGFQILAAHFSNRSIDFREVDFVRPTAIIMGTELYGVSDEALAQADEQIHVPMVGMVESLNVSVACGIILAEAQRQRLDAGSYEVCKLSEEEFNRLRFEWMQPRIASIFRSRGEKYPALDEDGDILHDEKEGRPTPSDSS
jgi:tRNA (guanosine-2'-O-)-methyltransferase